MNSDISSPIAVLGAGSWGTALAILLARNHQQVRLWGRDSVQMQTCARERSNPTYLPGISFPDNLTICPRLEDALDQVADVLIVVPSHAFRATLQACIPYCQPDMRFVWATKGLEPHSSLLLHEVALEELGAERVIGVLSGPTFAKEVALGLPTAITLATSSSLLAQVMTRRLHNQTFRVYSSSDLIGVQVGGAVKNVLAIAAGIADGLGFGANARCALITRGLVEMTRLGVALGGQPETFTGLSGLGDLILTSTDNQSRNRRFGLALGQGLSTQAAERSINQVIEGIGTTKEVHQLAQQQKVDMPITEQVYRMLYEGLAPHRAVEALFAREPKAE
jgi:glycerol-3-phosphate dehydrogenase (NAD(P)+)